MPAWSGNGLITGKADIKAAVARANQAAIQRGNLALLPEPVTTGSDAVPDTTGLLPVDPQLAPLLPWRGLKRGATITAAGSTSLLMLLLAGAMRGTDSWAAIVGMPQMGWLAAAELGMDMDRAAVIPEPGPDWPTIVAALLDGVDLVVVQPPADVAPSIGTALAARARQKGSVLLTTRAWPGGDLALEATERRWHGLQTGRGRLRYCELEVRSAGRGRAVRAKTATLMLGDARPKVRIPAPPSATGELAVQVNPLWANAEPAPQPADPWTTPTPAKANRPAPTSASAPAAPTSWTR
jgi:hypothetical protein